MQQCLTGFAVMMLISVPASFAKAQDITISGIPATRLFELASRLEQDGDPGNVEAIYRALEKDSDLEIRSEARFRHGQLLAHRHEWSEAAMLYRAILDEKPDAQRVRLEMASVLSQMGDVTGARQALRQAQAGGLPADVATVVDQYAAALRSQKPFNASFELSLAPSTNINRATSATTLDTILAPFQLSDDARAKSGLGLKVSGQTTIRLPLMSKLDFLVRFSGQANLYRASSFNDVLGSGQAGLEIRLGKMRLQSLAGQSRRWYGGSLYATTDTAALNIVQPIGKRAQVQVDFGTGWADYRQNILLSGPIYNGSVTYERALSSRAGAAITLAIDRQDAHDPGYATSTGSVQMLAWHDVGKASLYVSASMSRLIADDRLFLFKDKRREWQFRATLGGQLRSLTIAHFAPLVRITYERNRSTISIYDYRRVGAEFGIARAF